MPKQTTLPPFKLEKQVVLRLNRSEPCLRTFTGRFYRIGDFYAHRSIREWDTNGKYIAEPSELHPDGVWLISHVSGLSFSIGHGFGSLRAAKLAALKCHRMLGKRIPKDFDGKTEFKGYDKVNTIGAKLRTALWKIWTDEANKR